MTADLGYNSLHLQLYACNPAISTVKLESPHIASTTGWLFGIPVWGTNFWPRPARIRPCSTAMTVCVLIDWVRDSVLRMSNCEFLWSRSTVNVFIFCHFHLPAPSSSSDRCPNVRGAMLYDLPLFVRKTLTKTEEVHSTCRNIDPSYWEASL